MLHACGGTMLVLLVDTASTSPVGLLSSKVSATQLPPIDGMELQPLIAQVRRLLTALETIGAPLAQSVAAELNALMTGASPDALRRIQAILDGHCLVGVRINPEMRVTVQAGPAPRGLTQAGWRTFLAKVHNEAGTTAPLQAVSPQAQSVFSYLPAGDPRAVTRRRNVPDMLDPPEFKNPSDRAYENDRSAIALGDLDRWAELAMHDAQPMTPTLSGALLEYRILSIYSRDAGSREATLAFDVGQGTQDLGYRAEIALLFSCEAAANVRLRVVDADGSPVTASFVIRDRLGRLLPSNAKRLAPDLAFQPQVYRADGESLQLAPGAYRVEWRRGPESISSARELVVNAARSSQQLETFMVRRWIDPARYGYWSGDHHIHAAGCAHYLQPTEGVPPATMMRQVLGEDLKIGAVLTWGPGFEHQKQFFAGEADSIAQPPHHLHYDVEVSGFGSHQSGHLALLGLTSQMFTGAASLQEWPTLGLNTLTWAKAQGAICGAAHSGWGLAVTDDRLPSYEVPRYDGIGANEFIVDVTHEVPGPNGRPVPAVDFLSLCDTPYVWELNLWYHVLNSGFRQSVGGESDFPCIYGERVGTGRSYIRTAGPLTYRRWCEGLRDGRGYVGDGRAHLFDFRVNNRSLDDAGRELSLNKSGRVNVTLRAAVLLAEEPERDIGELPYTSKPYWHVERARVRGSHRVSVELVLNGVAVAQREITANGELFDLKFADVEIGASSWLAARILPAAHTNPIFVIVAGRPIRASRRSVRWCLDGVDQCWSQKARFIDPRERAAAEAAYDHARRVYRQRLAECTVD
jgi:hypothetical protein